MTEEAKKDEAPQAPQLDAVVAKMRVMSMEHIVTRHGPQVEYRTHKVKMGAVYGKEGENKDFADATPSGECWMNISEGRAAATFFEPGADYYVTFTKAPK